MNMRSSSWLFSHTTPTFPLSGLPSHLPFSTNIQCPSSGHVQTILVWLYLQNVQHALSLSFLSSSSSFLLSSQVSGESSSLLLTHSRTSPSPPSIIIIRHHRTQHHTFRFLLLTHHIDTLFTLRTFLTHSSDTLKSSGALRTLQVRRNVLKTRRQKSCDLCQNSSCIFGDQL